MSNKPLWENAGGEEWGWKDEGRDGEQASGSCIYSFSTIHLEWDGRGGGRLWLLRKSPLTQVNHPFQNRVRLHHRWQNYQQRKCCLPAL